ncbi:MAG: hypothetical protein V1875_04200 [Candidatus Altiarchaeota archaeon]
MSMIRRFLLKFAIVPALALQVAATAPYTWIPTMQALTYAIAWMIMIILGAKWIIADSANERQEAKKGMIYVVIGILVAASYCGLMCIYCDAAQISMAKGSTAAFPLVFNCGMGAIGCSPCT